MVRVNGGGVGEVGKEEVVNRDKIDIETSCLNSNLC